MLKFAYPQENEREMLKNASDELISGAEAYTYLCLGGKISDGKFFCGKNAQNDIKTLIFDTGDEYIKLFGDEDPPLIRFDKKCLMIYSKKEAKKSEAATPVENKAIAELYKLLTGENRLSYDNEARYVYRVRSINHGFGKMFAVKIDGKYISCAAVSASNKKYGLIADVFTETQYRRKGYAEKCINACIDFCLSNNLTPFLRCEENLCSYYEKLGFVYHGKM